MANKQIKDFPTVVSPAAGDYLHLSRGGVDNKITVEDLIPTLGGFGATVVNTFDEGAGFTAGVSNSVNLTQTLVSKNNAWVFFDGVYQEKETYSVSSNLLTFDEVIPEGVSTIEVVMPIVLPVGVTTTADNVQFAPGVNTEQLLAQNIVFDNVNTMNNATWLYTGLRCRTLGYTTRGDGGGNDYEIGSGFGTADGGSIIDLAGSGLQARGLFPSNEVYVEQFGARGDGSTDDSPAIFNAGEYVKTLIDAIPGPTSAAIESQKYVLFQASNVYRILTPITFNDDGKNVNWGCNDGVALLRGDDTGEAFIFQRLWQNRFKGLGFGRFTTAVTFDTNNVDRAKVAFEDCEWIGCDVGVDTVSFAASRSTVLEFIRCGCVEVPRLVNSYCDVLAFEDCFLRNWDDSGALIYADSFMVVRGGGFVPVAIGADARWIDLHSSDTSGTRGFASYGARWSGEAGGIPVVWNFIDSTASAGVTSESISFFGGLARSSGAPSKEAVVVLADNGGGASYAPDNIGFYGVDWSATNGLVATELGNSPGITVGDFVIFADEPTQSLLANAVTVPTQTFVESVLNQYVSYRTFDFRTETTTGNYVLDVVNGHNIRLQPGAPATITSVGTNVYDGTIIYLKFRDSNTTINDVSSGSNVHLQGNANFTGTTNDILVIQWDRAAATWGEISRSVN